MGADLEETTTFKAVELDPVLDPHSAIYSLWDLGFCPTFQFSSAKLGGGRGNPFLLLWKLSKVKLIRGWELENI